MLGLLKLLAGLSIVFRFAVAEPNSHLNFSEQSGSRDNNAPPIGDREVGLIAEWLNVPDSVIKNNFAERLASGTEKAVKENSEDAIALVMAQLLGSLPDNAREILGGKLSGELKSLERTDSPFAARIKRFLCGNELLRRGGNVTGMCGEELDRFKEAFKKIAPEVDRENIENLSKLATGEIPKNLIREALPGWLELQARHGNESAADQALRGLAGDRKFFDLNGNDKLSRVHFADGNLGAAKSLRQFAEKNGSLRNFSLPAAQGGGTPDVDFRPNTNPSAPKLTPKEEKKKEPEKREPEPEPSPSPSTSTQPPTPTAVRAAAAFQVLRDRCARCHVGADASGGAIMSGSGEPLTSGRIRRIFIRAVQRGTMPPEDEPQLSQAEKDTLSAWARDNGVE